MNNGQARSTWNGGMGPRNMQYMHTYMWHVNPIPSHPHSIPILIPILIPTPTPCQQRQQQQSLSLDQV